MLRHVALSLLALAAPQVAAERYVPLLSQELMTGAVNPCDNDYASCPRRLERLYDGLNRAWDLDDQSMLEYYQSSLRHYYNDHHPDENPCTSVFASCPARLDSIYRKLNRAQHRDDQKSLTRYQRELRWYYRNYRP